MSNTTESCIENVEMACNSETDKWNEKIEVLFRTGKLRSCPRDGQPKSHSDDADNENRGCQRSVRQHSYEKNFSGKKSKLEDRGVTDHTQQSERPIYRATTSRKVSFFSNRISINLKMSP